METTGAAIDTDALINLLGDAGNRYIFSFVGKSKF